MSKKGKLFLLKYCTVLLLQREFSLQRRLDEDATFSVVIILHSKASLSFFEAAHFRCKFWQKTYWKATVSSSNIWKNITTADIYLEHLWREIISWLQRKLDICDVSCTARLWEHNYQTTLRSILRRKNLQSERNSHETMKAVFLKFFSTAPGPYHSRHIVNVGHSSVVECLPLNGKIRCSIHSHSGSIAVTLLGQERSPQLPH